MKFTSLYLSKLTQLGSLLLELEKLPALFLVFRVAALRLRREYVAALRHNELYSV